MSSTDLPEPAPGIETSRFMGAWYILFSNATFWRQRTHPRVDYSELSIDDEGRTRFVDSLRYRQGDLLGREQRKSVFGVDVVERAGQFSWRGKGTLFVVKGRWSVPLIEPDYRWAVAYFARSNVGSGPELGIYTRHPTISQATLDQILAAIHEHPFLAAAERPGQPRRCDGLFATVQDWVPPLPYRLRV